MPVSFMCGIDLKKRFAKWSAGEDWFDIVASMESEAVWRARRPRRPVGAGGGRPAGARSAARQPDEAAQLA
ncbi:hypothetical protein GCM10023089_38350 [Quisquiliibacterium transsilvanicum]